MARYIDADKLLSELQEELEFETPMYTEKENECFNSGVKCAIRDVKSIPTADVAEVKHGEWVETADYGESKVVQCTSCEEDFWFKKKGQLNIDKMPHCPKCGAKMDGGKDEKDS